jgi:hypothetical protein
MISGYQKNAVKLLALFDEEISVQISIVKAPNVAREQEDGSGFCDREAVLYPFEMKVRHVLDRRR